MLIRIDDLKGPEIAALLTEHLRDMRMTSPPESIHALDLAALREPSVTFWTIWENDSLAGCGALKQIDTKHGEIKSMRTASASRRRGVGRKMLERIIEEAKKLSYQRLSLETGSMEYFEPARRLYEKHGFQYCAPFSTYKEDSNSVFMTLSIG